MHDDHDDDDDDDGHRDDHDNDGPSIEHVDMTERELKMKQGVSGRDIVDDDQGRCNLPQ